MQEENRFCFDIISYASHKIGSLLTVAKEGISLVSEETTGKINDVQKKSLLSSARAINRLTQLISDLIDLEKIINRKIKFRNEKINLYELIDYVCDYIQVEAGHKQISLENKLSVRLRLPTARLRRPDEPVFSKPADILSLVYVDRDKTLRSIINLLEYIIKFSFEKSQICITGHDSVNNSNTEFIEISIKSSRIIKNFINYDNSLSISRDIQTLLKDENINLNLIIAKALIECQGGQIKLLSVEDDKGEIIFSIRKYRQ